MRDNADFDLERSTIAFRSRVKTVDLVQIKRFGRRKSIRYFTAIRETCAVEKMRHALAIRASKLIHRVESVGQFERPVMRQLPVLIRAPGGDRNQGGTHIVDMPMTLAVSAPMPQHPGPYTTLTKCTTDIKIKAGL